MLTWRAVARVALPRTIGVLEPNARASEPVGAACVRQVVPLPRAPRAGHLGLASRDALAGFCPFQAGVEAVSCTSRSGHQRRRNGKRQKHAVLYAFSSFFPRLGFIFELTGRSALETRARREALFGKCRPPLPFGKGRLRCCRRRVFVASFAEGRSQIRCMRFAKSVISMMGEHGA